MSAAKDISACSMTNRTLTLALMTLAMIKNIIVSVEVGWIMDEEIHYVA